MTVVCRWIAAAGIASAMAWGVDALSGGRLAGGGSGVAWAQFAPVRAELSSSVHLDEVDSAARAHLERVKAFVGDQQWDEAVETLRQVMENYGSKVIAMTDSRYVNVWDYCHLQISALPPPALALYRQRVDPLAKKGYEEGVANHDSARLANVLNQFFCSTWGDRALWAMGEMSLEQGDYGAARGYWEKLIERAPEAIPAARFEAVCNAPDLPADQAKLIRRWYSRDENEASERWMEHKGPIYKLHLLHELPDQTSAELASFWKAHGLSPARLAYPETKLALPDIHARLVLCSILEGSLDRARKELETFARQHPDAQGQLAGRKVNFVEGLAALIASAEKWPESKSSRDWPTFAGGATRSKIAPPLVDLGAEAWPPISLGEAAAADGANRAFNFRRPGEDFKELLSYHPLVVGDSILVCNRSSILAFNAKTGKPAWTGDPNKPPGEIYSDDSVQQAANRVSRVGVPRFCLTAHGGRLYACMGSQVTNRPFETFDSQRGYLVCLDLSAQGRLMWKIAPDDDKWSFEGAPLVEGGNVYVAMRKSDVRPQAHVACYDAETSRLRWRSFVCSAEGPGGGQVEEITHNLLTLDHGMIYFNTNLGAVAALSTRDGQVQWATLYPRAGKNTAEGHPSTHFLRDLNPCIFYRGMLFIAPSDSKWILCLDAATGQFLGENELPDVVHLLGVAGNHLIASGDRIYWLNIYDGLKLADNWPDITPPYGYGRGLLSGDDVLWPTRTDLYVFSQRQGRKSLAERAPIPLSVGRGGGGNLVIADKLLIIATANKLFAYERRSGEKKSAVPGKVADTPETAPGK